ncbi:hypothetical protein FT643_14675 [Ketobacter sp. MCCC 1A13808]|uniref:hypothetical protein n=1 Tax=Ketobacter sp. MCCC 1A13808 TaxID=2602738 RepID=UPI0012EB5C76|nr:hypothetical protein [Ketobacter sp. MCCC 1A13808]MVF13383.1 hypothetical protein [Ketobacter sp. MCCC 1A13808]
MNSIFSLVILLFISSQTYAQLASCNQKVSFKGEVKTVSCFENVSYPKDVFSEYCKSNYFLEVNDPEYVVVHKPVAECKAGFKGVCKDPNFPTFGDMKPRKMGFSTYYYKNLEMNKIAESCKLNGGTWIEGAR